MRTLAIGDIHGHLDALNALIAIVHPLPEDTLIFLGDYVDKGPNVRGVIDRLLELNSTHHAIFLRGNHDQMMLDAHLDQVKILLWKTLAGDGALASYGPGEVEDLLDRVPSAHWHFLEHTCRDYFRTSDFIFVHGGIRAHKELATETPDYLQWSTLATAAPHISGKTVICGHSSQRNGIIADLEHTICIDTGITHGGWLTCLELETFSYWQANASGNTRTGALR